MTEIHVLKAKEIQEKTANFSHPWNPNSQVTGTTLSRLTGLQRSGVNFVRIPPGKESFVYHEHHREEEWIYILSGKAEVEINGEVHQIERGDFVGFPAPGTLHHLRNNAEEELVYLMGGEHTDLEVVNFPRHNKVMVRRGENITIFNQSEGKGFWDSTDHCPST